MTRLNSLHSKSLRANVRCANVLENISMATALAGLLMSTPATAQIAPSAKAGMSMNVRMLPDLGAGATAVCAARLPGQRTMVVGGNVVDAADYTIW